MQELQRNRGLTTGRLDARFAGPTYNLIGEAADTTRKKLPSAAHSLALQCISTRRAEFGGTRIYQVAANFQGNPGLEARQRLRILPGSPSVVLDLVLRWSQSKAESRSRKWLLRSRNAVHGNGIQHGASRVSDALHKNLKLQYYEAAT